MDKLLLDELVSKFTPRNRGVQPGSFSNRDSRSESSSNLSGSQRRLTMLAEGVLLRGDDVEPLVSLRDVDEGVLAMGERSLTSVKEVERSFRTAQVVCLPKDDIENHPHLTAHAKAGLVHLGVGLCVHTLPTHQPDTPPPSDADVSEVRGLVFEVDANLDPNSLKGAADANTDVDTELIRPLRRSDAEKQRRAINQTQRTRLLPYFAPRFHPSTTSRHFLTLGELPLKHRQTPRLFVDFKSLALGGQNLEPLFLVAALYDVRRKLRISENVHINVTGESSPFHTLLDVKGGDHAQRDPSLCSTKRVFVVSDPSPDVYLFFRVERILSGDVDDSLGLYGKDLSDADREKVVLRSHELCNRLYEYHQPYMFGFLPLFDNSGQLKRSARDHVEVTCFYKQKEAMFDRQIVEAILELSSPSNKSKPLAFPCSLQLRIKQLEPPALNPVFPNEDICSPPNDDGSPRSDSEEDSEESDGSDGEHSGEGPGSDHGGDRTPSVRAGSVVRPDSEPEPTPKTARESKLSGIAPRLPLGRVESKPFDSLSRPVHFTKLPAYRHSDNASLLECGVKQLVDQHGRLVLCEGSSHHNNHEPVSPADCVREVQEFEATPSIEDCWSHMNSLYVEPTVINGKVDGRNLAVTVKLLASDDDISKPGERCVQGNYLQPSFVTEGVSHVTYHSSSPCFSSETKMTLPECLTPTHHLVFTVRHVGCAVKEKGTGTRLVGYAVFPLFQSHRLEDVGGGVVSDEWSGQREFSLPIHDEKDVAQGSYLSRLDSASGGGKKSFSMFSGSKATLTFRLRVLSTIYPWDVDLCEFVDLPFPQVGKLDPKTVATRLEALATVPPSLLIVHLPLVLNKIVGICAVRLSEFDTATTLNAFKTLVRVMSLAHDKVSLEENAPRVLTTWIKYMWRCEVNGEFTPLHKPLCDAWIRCCREKAELQQAYEDSVRLSTFLFELILKSIVLTLRNEGLLNLTRCDDQKLHALGDAIGSIKELIQELSRDIVLRGTVKLATMRPLNRSIAFFVRDLFCLLPRASVMDLINVYCDEMGHYSLGSSEMPVILKFNLQFVEVILDSEFFVPLAQPQPIPFTTEEEYLLRTAKAHPLPQLMLTMMGSVLEYTKENRVSCVTTFRTHLTKLSLDPRYQNDAVKQAIFGMYFPFVIAVSQMPIREQREAKTGDDELRALLVCFLAIIKGCPTLTMQWLLQLSTRHTDALMDVLSECLLLFPYHGIRTEMPAGLECSLDARSVHALLQDDPEDISATPRFGSVSAPPPTPGHSQSSSFSMQPRSGGSGLELLEAKYSQSAHRRAQRGSRRRTGGTMGDIAGAGAMEPPGGSNRNSHRMSRSFVSPSISSLAGLAEGPEPAGASDPRLLRYISRCEGGLATEVGMVCVWVLRVCVERQKEVVDNERMPRGVLSLMAKFGRPNHSSKLTLSWLSTLRLLLEREGDLLFDADSDREWTFAMCEVLLGLLTFSSKEIRTQAAATLFMMFRCNMTVSDNITRMSYQCMRGVATLLARLDSTGSDKEKEQKCRELDRLYFGIAAMAQYATLELAKRKGDRIATRVDMHLKDLVSLAFALQQIVHNTKYLAHMRHTLAPEDTASLFLGIAHHYSSAPILRVQTLLALSSEQKEAGNTTESGICIVHVILAIVDNMDNKEHELYSCIAKNLSAHLSLQWRPSLRADVAARNAERLAKDGDDLFTEMVMIRYLKQALGIFFNAERYEMSVLVAKQLEMIGERLRMYVELSFYHKQMMVAYEAINEAEKSKARFLGTYYRVVITSPSPSLIASLFPPLPPGLPAPPPRDQHAFIFKEPKLTRLGEITDKIKGMVEKKLRVRRGKEGEQAVARVVVLAESGDVDLAKLDRDCVYVQITHVEPHFEGDQLVKRVTVYEKNTNVPTFAFSTPFTASGSKHGGLAEQQVRVMRMSVDGAFPCMTTRLRVTGSDVVELSPIQNATAVIEDQTNRLKGLLGFYPELNVLQMTLQGVVKTTVNEGPLAIARTFLASSEPSIGEREGDRERLKMQLTELVTTSARALEKEEELIKWKNASAMLPFHEELRKGYVDLLNGLGEVEGDGAKKKGQDHSDSHSDSDGDSQSQSGEASDGEEGNEKGNGKEEGEEEEGKAGGV